MIRLALLSIASSVLLACPPPDTEPQENPLDWAVDEPGPYNVGYREWEISYMPEAGDGERTIVFNVWYPTNATRGDEVRYEELFVDELSFGDAPFAPPPYDGGAPVHLYSHGHQGFAGSTSFLMRYFASHGWVVVAPDHRGNTLLTNIDPRPADIYHFRSQDVTVTLDTLAGLPADDPLAGCCNTDEVLLSGHSYGSYTVWASMGATFDQALVDGLCGPGGELEDSCDDADKAVFAAGLGDHRFVAGMPMAGTLRRSWVGDTGHRSVQGPIFSMTGTDDSVGQQAQWDSMDEIDFTWIDVEGGCHQLYGIGGCGEISDDVGFPIVNTYGLAYGRRHVLGDEQAATLGILDGSIAVSSLVRFEQL